MNQDVDATFFIRGFSDDARRVDVSDVCLHNLCCARLLGKSSSYCDHEGARFGEPLHNRRSESFGAADYNGLLAYER